MGIHSLSMWKPALRIIPFWLTQIGCPSCLCPSCHLLVQSIFRNGHIMHRLVSWPRSVTAAPQVQFCGCVGSSSCFCRPESETKHFSAIDGKQNWQQGILTRLATGKGTPSCGSTVKIVRAGLANAMGRSLDQTPFRTKGPVVIVGVRDNTKLKNM
jgi:hypothetical protein